MNKRLLGTILMLSSLGFGSLKAMDEFAGGGGGEQVASASADESDNRQACAKLQVVFHVIAAAFNNRSLSCNQGVIAKFLTCSLGSYFIDGREGISYDDIDRIAAQALASNESTRFSEAFDSVKAATIEFFESESYLKFTPEEQRLLRVYQGYLNNRFLSRLSKDRCLSILESALEREFTE